MMELIKRLAGLTKEQKVDIVRLKAQVARRALEQSKDDDPAVREFLGEYSRQCEKLLEKMAWS